MYFILFDPEISTIIIQFTNEETKVKKVLNDLSKVT